MCNTAIFFNIITIVFDAYLWYTLFTYIYIYKIRSSMTNKTLLKITIWGVFLIFLMALLALPISLTPNTASSLRYAGGELSPELVEDFSSERALSPRSLLREEDSYIFDSTYGGWQQVLLWGDSAYYFGLNSTEQYSALATLTTPQLILADNNYTLFVDYFSMREESFPNTLTLYSSIDGQNYIKLHTEKAFFTDNSYKTISVNLPYGSKYIKLEAKVYADIAGQESGIYIDNIGIAAHNNYSLSSLTAEDFTLDILENNIVYDGKTKLPSFSLTCSDDQAKYFAYTYISTSTQPSFSKGISALDAGTYYLHAAIFSINNEYFDTVTVSFTISKADLVVDMSRLVYTLYPHYIIIHNLPLYDAEGLLIAPSSLGDVSYTLSNGETDTTSTLTCIAIPFIGSFDLFITVAESANYNQAVSDTITVDETPFEGEFLFFNTEQNSIYDGTAQNIDYFFFTIPDGNVENLEIFEYTGEDFSIAYTLNGEAVDEPINAGKYLATLTYKTKVTVINFEITKRTLIAASYIGSDLNKTYDGSTVLYYTRKENIEDTDTVSSAAATLKSHDFVLGGVMGDDEVLLSVASAKYNFNLGQVKVLLRGLSLMGEHSNNYQLDTNFITDLYFKVYTISPATLSLAPQANGDNTLLIKSKIYDGSFDAAIDFEALDGLYGERNLVPLTFYGLSGTDSLDINSLQVEFLSKYAGNRAVKLWHNDPTMLDRYHQDIALSALFTPLCGAILPKTLDIDTNLSAITVEDKVYSGDNIANVTFGACSFNSPLGADETTLNNSLLYKIVFESATFSQSRAGENIAITVQNISLAIIDAAYADIIGSYAINDLILYKDIAQKEMFLITEYLRISGGIIPELVVEPRGVATSSSYYNSLSDAQNDTNRLAEPTANGIYYIRVTSSDSNYFLENGYGIITLVITTQKADQTILFDYAPYLSDGAITMLKGGSLTPQAYSVADTGERTNLTISYTISGEQSLYSFDSNSRTLTALNTGSISIIAAQSGDAFYNATSTAITLNIVDYSPSFSEVTVASTAYVAENLPLLNGNAKVNGGELSSNFVALDTLVEPHKEYYNYRLSFDSSYVGYYDFEYSLQPTFMNLKITLPAQISREYYQNTDFLNYVDIAIERGERTINPPRSDYASFGLVFAFSDIDFAPGSYTLSFLQGQNNFVGVTTNKNYTVQIIGESINLVVGKSVISVKMPAITKHYGQDNIQPSTNSVIFEGNCRTEDQTIFRNSLNFYMYCNKLSPVGSYAINISMDFEDMAIYDCYDFDIVNSFMIVEPASLSITTTAPSSVYGGAITYHDIVINGLYLAEDYAYLKSYVTTSHSVTSRSNVGTYTIFVDYFGNDGNYQISEVSGVYTVIPASFSGITFENQKVLYDGKKHRLQITYDPSWTDITVVYNITEVWEVGVYNITATVSKPNYATTTYTAKLTIATLNLASSSQTNKVEILDMTEGASGFSPDLTLSVHSSQVEGIRDKVNAMLKSLSTQQETVVAIYDITLLQDNTAVDTPDGNYRIKITIPNITTNSNIRILASVDNELKEVAHTFENGYFVFETDSLNGIAILKTTQITESRISTIVVVSIVGVVVLAMFGIIIGSFAGGRKATLRSRRKHHKWF